MDMQIFSNSEMWIIEAAIAFVILVAVNYLVKSLLKIFRRRFLSQEGGWQERCDQIFYLPLHVMLWVIGISFIAGLMAHRFHYPKIVNYIHIARDIALIICSAWLLLRWKKEAHVSFLSKQGKHRVDPSLVHILSRLASICIVIIGLLLVLQIIGLNITPLLAFGGIGAAALAFASKDVIGNFFGGFMLYMTRPFTIGDLILLPDRRLEGHVEEIGWYITTVRDKDKRPLYLPNAIFSNQVVVNSSRMSHRRIEQRIGISYEDAAKMSKIVQEIKNAIEAHPAIDTNLPVLVFFNDFNQYSLDIYIDVYTLATRYDQFLEVKQEILFLIEKVILDNGAKMPFPTTTFHIPNLAEKIYNVKPTSSS